MQKTSTTRENILKRATALFQGKGYNGFSFRDIAEPMGIKNAAVHYHFHSKADLGLAVIERYTDLLHLRTGQFMTSGGPALPMLEGYFAFHRNEVVDRHRVCPIGNAAISIDELPDQISAATRRLSTEVLAFLTRVLELGREQGTMNFDGPAEQKALAIQATLQGSGQLSRIAGPGVVDRILDSIRTDLKI